MPRKTTMSLDFSSPAERVFAALSDHANAGRWLGAKLTLVKPGDANGTGAVRRLHLGLKTLDEEITVSQPPTYIEYTIVRGLFPLNHHLGVIRVTPKEGNHCHVVWTIELGSAIAGVEKLVATALKYAIQTGLRRLDKQLLA